MLLEGWRFGVLMWILVIRLIDIDHSQRTVGRIYVDDLDVGVELVCPALPGYTGSTLRI
jgi:hypothetical protein